MYKNIIIGLSLEQEIGKHLLALAKSLLADGGKITAIHVIDDIPRYAQLYVKEDKSQEIKSNALEQIKNSIGDGDGIEKIILSGNPGQMIVDFAKDNGADCIIVGSHKPGLKDFFLGSTAARIVRYSPCSVHIRR